MKSIVVSVTQADIKYGRRYFEYTADETCPVAHALKRMYPRHRVKVGYRKIIVEGLFEVKSPKDVVKFVKDFDESEKVKPATFTVEIPD